MPPELAIPVAELVKSFGQFHEGQPKVLTTSATKLVPLEAGAPARYSNDGSSDSATLLD